MGGEYAALLHEELSMVQQEYIGCDFPWRPSVAVVTVLLLLKGQ